MSQKSWWAYIPEWCEEGVVVNADTFDEAVDLASAALLKMEWTDALNLEWLREVVADPFYMYELGPLHFCNFTEEEEE
tara:strand:+ start:349 stop:582 length:234 start_codon:yes stop_codon:yes gene_type:complete